MKKKEKDIIERLVEIRNATLLASKEVYNTEEACMYLGLARSSLYEMVHNNTIPYFKSRGGKLTYFKRKDLDNWMMHTKVEGEYTVLRPMRYRAGTRPPMAAT